jgi:hypothetical protein
MRWFRWNFSVAVNNIVKMYRFSRIESIRSWHFEHTTQSTKLSCLRMHKEINLRSSKCNFAYITFLCILFNYTYQFNDFNFYRFPCKNFNLRYQENPRAVTVTRSSDVV